LPTSHGVGLKIDVVAVVCVTEGLCILL
jgi:hypothetical protein